MPKVTIIRHAPTISSEQGIFMGGLDIPITEKARSSAEKLGKQLEGENFTKHYSSPMLRARQTAERIFPGTSIVYEPSLRERGLGQWEGKSKQEIKSEYAEAFLESGPINPFFTPPGGETIENVIDRVYSFLRNVFFLGENQHVAVVTHNGVIRVMRCLIELRPMEEIFHESESYLKPRTYDIDERVWKAIKLHHSRVCSEM